MPKCAPSILILDFDGTVAIHDVGNAICERFADPSWRALDDRYDAGELSIDQAQREMWALVTADEQALRQMLPEVAALRPGTEALLVRAQTAGVPVYVASGGFEWYIDRLLGPLRSQIQARWANQLEFHPGQRITPRFVHLDTLGCPRCAVCKGKVIDEVRRRHPLGTPVVYVGDGTSDRCAVGRADTLWAVRGSKLARYCAEANAPHRLFEHFDEIILAGRNGMSSNWS